MMTLVKFKNNGRSNDLFDFPLMSREFFQDAFNPRTFFSEVVNEVQRIPLNIMEQEQGIQVELMVPGFEKEQIQVEVVKNTLKISATVEAKEEKEEKNFFRKEFSIQSFEKTLKLPETVDATNIQAELKSGILKVFLPKNVKSEEMVQRIQVK